MRGIPVAFSAGLFLLMCGCGSKPWQGKFVAPGNSQCHILEFVEVHGDQTADLKYADLGEVGNFPTHYSESDSLLIIRQTNRQWAFKWNGNDTLYEVSGIDLYCFLVRAN